MVAMPGTPDAANALQAHIFFFFFFFFFSAGDGCNTPIRYEKTAGSVRLVGGPVHHLRENATQIEWAAGGGARSRIGGINNPGRVLTPGQKKKKKGERPVGLLLAPAAAGAAPPPPPPPRIPHTRTVLASDPVCRSSR